MYQVKVGDLCYVSLGQIVNRNYSPIYYRPSLMTIVNSPVVNPKVAEAARLLWADCDRQAHARSLISDLSDISIRWRREDAITRLLAFYPDVGTNQVTHELRRPTYSLYRVITVLDRVLAAPSGTIGTRNRVNLLDTCDLPTLSGILDELPRRMKWSPQLCHDYDGLAAEIHNRVGQLPLRPISASSQASFVDHLHPFPSSVIDDAVLQLALNTAKAHLEREPDSDALLLACAKRLIGSPEFGLEIRQICSSVPDTSPLSAAFQELATSQR